MKTEESKIGSSAYAIELADAIDADEDGADLGPTDAEECAKALRYFAGRWRRRAAYAAVLAIVAALGVGLPDLNGAGPASLADLGAVARQAVDALSPSVAALIRPARS